MKQINLRIFGLCLLLSCSIGVQAQSNQVLNHWGLSLSAGVNFPYTDVTHAQPTPDFSATFLLQPVRSLQLSAGLHYGVLKAAYDENSSSTLKFKTDYIAPTVLLRFFPVALSPNRERNPFIQYASGLYIGGGAAILNTDVSAKRLWRKDYGSYGDYSAAHLIYLVEVGYQHPVALLGNNSRLLVSAQYRLNFVQDDKLDGYMPLPEGSSENDAYNTLSIGLVWTW